VDEEGQVCLSIILPENWKPATKTDEGSFWSDEWLDVRFDKSVLDLPWC